MAERSRPLTLSDIQGPRVTDKPGIVIAIPSQDTWKAQFGLCLTQLMASFVGKFVASGQAKIMVTQDYGTVLPFMRESLADAAVEGGASHILWLDNDMTFPPDTIERLLAHGKPIVGANYSQRRQPCTPVAMRDSAWVYTDKDSTGLEDVDFVGFGCVLTETSVFKELPKPWFSLARTGAGRLVGEDVWFCHKAWQDLRVKTFIDHDLSKEVGHIGMKVYEHADTWADREEQALIDAGKKKRCDYLVLPHERKRAAELGLVDDEAA